MKDPFFKDRGDVLLTLWKLGALIALLAVETPLAYSSSSVKAVKIVFKQSSSTGSFDAPPANGTPARVGSGLKAVRYFAADGSLLSSAPSWLSYFELGVSGASNTSAPNGACARFADSTEGSGQNNCFYSSSANQKNCGAPTGLFRVSEFDCLYDSTRAASVGTGGPNDGIYFRATLNRSAMGSSENLLVVLEYVAASANAGPSTPTNCLKNGKFVPEACSDTTWKTYVKRTASDVVQPFLLLIPPTQTYAQNSSTTGANPVAKQFTIPLASDPLLSVVQVSRVGSSLNISDSTIQQRCGNYSATLSAPATPANTPLCAGVVLYSVTLYRI